MRSPSSAPCVNGLVGSTESTPTVSPSARRWRQSAEIRLDLPEPGGPVRPMCAAPSRCAGRRAPSARHRARSRFSTRLIARATARRSPASTRRTSSAGSPARLRGPGAALNACRSCACGSTRPHPTIANSAPAAHSSQTAPASSPSENRPSAPRPIAGSRRASAVAGRRRIVDERSDAPRRSPRGSRSRRGRAPSSRSGCRRAAARAARPARGRSRPTTRTKSVPNATAADERGCGWLRLRARGRRGARRTPPARGGAGADGAGEGALGSPGSRFGRRAARARRTASRADAMQVGELELDRPGRDVERQLEQPLGVALCEEDVGVGQLAARGERSGPRPPGAEQAPNGGRVVETELGRNPQDARLGIRCHERPRYHSRRAAPPRRAAVPARHRPAAGRGAAAAHLRASLPRDGRALPRRSGAVLRRARRRRRDARRRLPGDRPRGRRALRRRAPQHRRDRRRADQDRAHRRGRARLPGRRRRDDRGRRRAPPARRRSSRRSTPTATSSTSPRAAMARRSPRSARGSPTRSRAASTSAPRSSSACSRRARSPRRLDEVVAARRARHEGRAHRERRERTCAHERPRQPARGDRARRARATTRRRRRRPQRSSSRSERERAAVRRRRRWDSRPAESPVPAARSTSPPARSGPTTGADLRFPTAFARGVGCAGSSASASGAFARILRLLREPPARHLALTARATTLPAPPRRGSPAASSRPPGCAATACAPPK